MATATRTSRSLRNRLLAGCLLLVLLAGAALAAFVFGVYHLAGGNRHDSVAPPGDPHGFDPVARYPDVARYAGTDARLVGMRAMFVRRDGTLDLKADYRPAPHAVYSFARSVPAPQDAPPLGAGGSPDGRWFEAIEVEVARPWQLRSVRSVGAGGSRSYQYFSRGMERKAATPTGQAPASALSPPACPLRALWDAAVTRGASPEAVAIVEYGRQGYDFTIPGARFVMRFDARCQPRDR